MRWRRTSSWTFTTSSAPPPPLGCPCSIWARTASRSAQDSDHSADRSRRRGSARRSPASSPGCASTSTPLNTGTHVGDLWTSTGTQAVHGDVHGRDGERLAAGAFRRRSPIAANTTYVASYHAPTAATRVSNRYFAAAGVDTWTAARAPRDGQSTVRTGLRIRQQRASFPTQHVQFREPTGSTSCS